jgi:hypothetical protein
MNIKPIYVNFSSQNGSFAAADTQFAVNDADFVKFLEFQDSQYALTGITAYFDATLSGGNRVGFPFNFAILLSNFDVNQPSVVVSNGSKFYLPLNTRGTTPSMTVFVPTGWVDGWAFNGEAGEYYKSDLTTGKVQVTFELTPIELYEQLVGNK